MYTQNDIAIMYLDTLGLTHKHFTEVLKILKNPSDIFINSARKNIIDLLPSGSLERLDILGYNSVEELVTKDLEKFNITAVTIASSMYPDILKNIADPPVVLYTKGDINLLSKNKIGIVGTRTPTNYGRDVANKFTKDLSDAGLVTVSGLSYGIDTCVAVSTLEAKGKTIAVLAGGLDNVYPAQNTELSKKIEQNGLLVSEYRPYVRPRQYSFIRRNRIISGLSLGVFVVEAGRKSGATSTAAFCLEQNRELFVLPGNITSPQSYGTNDLINEMPDCFTITSSQILDRLNIKPKQTKKQTKLQLDVFSLKIVECLKNGELHFDEICKQVNSNASELASTLTMLEILGVVKKSTSNFYQLVF